MKMEKTRCQSCGMPLGDSTDYRGTESDSSPSPDYCKFCYIDGKFTEQLSMQQMIDKSVAFMVSNLKFSKEEATSLSNKVIPSLKRWK